MLKAQQRYLAGVVAGAQLLLASPGFAAPTLGAGTTDIGVAGAVAGRVARTNQQIVGEIVASGKPIYLGDQIDTDPAGRLQVLLRDETVFTIGPSSSLVIDAFVYDPQQRTGKLAARAIKGTFRFVSGQIARTRPADMEVRLPTGVIGIRGTIVAGRIDGDKCRIVLLGPGVQNNAGERPGQITVANTINGRLESVLLTRPGYGTEIPGANLPPTPPAPVPPAELQALTQSLESAPPPAAPDPTPPPPGEPTATEAAGQDLISALLSLLGISSLSELSEDLTELSDQAVLDAADTLILTDEDVEATWEEVRTRTTGSGHYVGSAALNDGGSFGVDINIDFGARQIGGGNSKVTASSSVIDSLTSMVFPVSGTTNFPTSGIADVNLVPTGSPISNTASPCSSACQMTSLLIGINKAPGAAAGSSDIGISADFDVIIKNTSTGNTVLGFLDEADLKSGSAP